MSEQGPTARLKWFIDHAILWWHHFWALPWRWKGSALGVAAAVVALLATLTVIFVSGGDDDNTPVSGIFQSPTPTAAPTPTPTSKPTPTVQATASATVAGTAEVQQGDATSQQGDATSQQGDATSQQGDATSQTPPPAVATPTTLPPPPNPTATPKPKPKPTPTGSRIPWQGGEWYLQGANVPWYNWGCDFGCGQNGGVASAGVQAALHSGFAQLQASGMPAARWWVFPGDPWQITRDGSGAPSGIDPAVYADFDAALALAEQYDLYYVFTLFSSATDLPGSWLTDPARRSQLAGALGQLFARYADNPRVLTWQVFNEPEWQIWNGEVAEADVQAVVSEIADSVHANSSAYVSVGSAMLDGLPMWVGLGLDYYTAHWYDYMSSGGWCARCTDYAEVQARFGLDAPLVIGEFYAGPDTDALQRFEDWYAKGYAGAWGWSLFSDRTFDGMAIDLDAAGTFAAAHIDIGP